jgi:D-alanine-D-alanine ligase
VTTERIHAIVHGRIGVLMGGMSSEREVSLASGAGVLAALHGRGHEAVGIDWEAGVSLPGELIENDVLVVWNALHGTFGEDGAVQGLLTCMNIPYTGSGILASALAMDKVASKRIFDHAGVPSPAWRIIPPHASERELADVELPVVVKPSCEGSSVGVSLVFEREDLLPAVALARRHRGVTLIEPYIAGAEVCVGILAEEVLGTVEVRPALGFYDYEAKYRREDTEYLVPAPLDPAVLARVEEVALAAHRVLGCSGHSRVDLRVNQRGAPYVLEVNTLPGMTGHSLIPKIAAHRGIEYAELCERILSLASLRQGS